MPRYTKPIPPLLAASQVEKIAQLQRREADLAWQITHPFESLLLDWRTRIEQFFLRQFVISLRPDRQAVWNPQAIAALDEVLLRPLRAERATLEQEATPIILERQRGIFLLAAAFARWQVSLGGATTPEPLPSTTQLGSIDGVGFRGRLTVWGQIFQGKVERTLRAHVVGGSTLPETLFAVDTIAQAYERHVSALAQNEGYRAAAEGEYAALAPFRRLIDEVWVCKPDACRAICWPRHLTTTPLIPIRDSHPSCRCTKVPIVRLFTPTPSAFTSFTP